MGGEDWPNPLPKGWILKKFSNGKVWAHNTKTGQTFHTKKDLLRYVHYAETILPLFANKTIPYQDDQAISDSKGKAIDDNAGNSSEAPDDGEGNSEQPSDDKDGISEEGYDNDDDSLYGGIDFSKGIWSVDAEIIERSYPLTERKKKVKDDQLPKRKKMKVEDDKQDDQQPEMKMESKSGTEQKRNKRAGPTKNFEMPPKRMKKFEMPPKRKKKFEMPPKRYRGEGSRKNHHHKP